MAIDLKNMPSIFRARSAVQTQAVLVNLGIEDERFVICGSFPKESRSEAGVFCDKEYFNHYWLRHDNSYVEYFIQNPSIDFSPLAIPFFVDDFGINRSILLDMSISLETIRTQIYSRFPRISINIASVALPTPDEGFFIQLIGSDIRVVYAERGNCRFLGKTRYPWSAGLAVAWFNNYKAINWSD